MKYEWDEKRNLTEYEYDLAGKRTAVIHHLNGVPQRHEYTYYDNGELRTETDALQRTTTYVINALDQRIETQYANSTAVQQRFDAMGARTRQIDQRLIATDYRYDDLGRLEQVQPDVVLDNQRAPNTTYRYDEVGNKLSQTDANGHTTTWTYDYFGRVLSRTLPEGMSETFVYDDSARTLTHTDFNGRVSVTQYDVMGREERVDYDNGSSEAYTYWPNGQVRTVTDTSLSQGTGITQYGYDTRDRLDHEIQPDGTRLDHDYDDAGNRTQVRVTRNGAQVSVTDYTFDGLNRLETTTDANGTIVYSYDAVGNLDTVTYPNGTVHDYDYNSVNQLEVLTHTNADGALLQRYTYTLDETGRRDMITESNGRVTDHDYDDLYRLVGAAITDPINGDYSASYQYDWVGNRTYETVDGVQTAYSYDDNDRLLQTGGTVFTYDDQGNTRTETLDGVITTYHYDERNRLIEADTPTGTVSYTYNNNGIRTGKTENDVTTRFIVDENRDYAQVLHELADDQIQVSYTYGHDLISQDRDSTTRFYHYDGLGSTRALSDAGGSLTDAYEYEAFGELLSQTGSTENSYLFAGEQFDSSLDQYYLRARYYNQSIGRFTQQDTWMGKNHDPITLHKYLYANADPVNHIDPTGNFSLGSFSAASTINGILTTMSIASSAYDVFQIASGEKEFSARELGTSILLSRLPIKFVKKLLTKACKVNSFDGDTLVSTEHGLVSISEIKIGDKVWVYDELTGNTALQEVVHLITNEGEKVIAEITLESGEKIVATGDHPFYIPKAEVWSVAKDIQGGDYLFDISGQLVRVDNVEITTKSALVYNLTVDKSHTYFVGASGVLSHNASCFKLKSRIKENPKLVKEAQKAGKDQKVQRDFDDLTAKLSEGNLNPGIGTKPIGKGISEARSRDGARVYFRVIKGEVEILGKSSKANQDVVIKEILKTFK